MRFCLLLLLLLSLFRCPAMDIYVPPPYGWLAPPTLNTCTNFMYITCLYGRPRNTGRPRTSIKTGIKSTSLTTQDARLYVVDTEHQQPGEGHYRRQNTGQVCSR